MPIKTNTKRLDTLSKLLVGTTMLATISLGVAANVPKDVHLAGRDFTKEEYGQLKVELVQKIKGVPTRTERQLWMATFNRENKRCQFNLTNVNQDNVMEKLNEQLELLELGYISC